MQTPRIEKKRVLLREDNSGLQDRTAATKNEEVSKLWSTGHDCSYGRWDFITLLQDITAATEDEKV